MREAAIMEGQQIMEAQMGELEEMLRLGCCMGPGERYLMLYEGQPAITNRTGMAYWPKGERRMIAVFDEVDCARVLTQCKSNAIFERLQKVKNSANAKRVTPVCRIASKLSRPLHPT